MIRHKLVSLIRRRTGLDHADGSANSWISALPSRRSLSLAYMSKIHQTSGTKQRAETIPTMFIVPLSIKEPCATTWQN